jgi:hypothetical protein
MTSPRFQIIALLLATASAQANVGDTVDQLFNRWPGSCSVVSDNTIQCNLVGYNKFLQAIIDPHTARVASESLMIEVNGIKQPVEETDNVNMPNHCEIVAQRGYNALRYSAAWCVIVGLHFNQGDVGHAAVLYKHQMDGPVIYYDDRGSLELPTTSTNPDDIIRAMNHFPEKFKGGVKSMGFLTG